MRSPWTRPQVEVVTPDIHQAGWSWRHARHAKIHVKYSANAINWKGRTLNIKVSWNTWILYGISDSLHQTRQWHIGQLSNEVLILVGHLSFLTGHSVHKPYCQMIIAFKSEMEKNNLFRRKGLFCQARQTFKGTWYTNDYFHPIFLQVTMWFNQCKNSIKCKLHLFTGYNVI